MNKQEAINRVEELYGYGSIAKTVTDIISQIDQPQKVVVPKCVGEWIEEAKNRNFCLVDALVSDLNPTEVDEWLYGENDKNQETFARAWLDGFEIEEEKLYTVEIPNPHATHDDVYILGRTKSGDIAIWRSLGRGGNKNYDSDFQLTESEIKKDFDWAWQFAKEVE